MRALHTTSRPVSSSVSEIGPSALLVAALCFGTGCDAIGGLFGADHPIVYVDIRERDPASKDKLDRPKLEEAMKEVMKSLPGFSFRNAKADEVPYQLVLMVEQVTERWADPVPGKTHTEIMRRSVGVRLELFESKNRTRYSGEAIEVQEVRPQAGFDGIAKVALQKAGRDLRLGIELAEASDAKVMKLLADSDDAQRGRAIALAGERKLKDARPALEALLEQENIPDNIVLLAIGALMQIGDASSVAAMIEAGRDKGPEFQTQVIFALGQLGGKEAEAYLFTVESGHPDPAMKEVAGQALKELERRRAPN